MKSVLFYGRKPDPSEKLQTVVKAAKTCVRVSIYRTKAIVALRDALDGLEGKR